MDDNTISEIEEKGLVKALGGGILRWTGTDCPQWERTSPLSTWQTTPFVVCDECQILVELLAVDDRYSLEDVNKFLQEYRDHVLGSSEHGYHPPICGQLARGQKLRS